MDGGRYLSFRFSPPARITSSSWLISSSLVRRGGGGALELVQILVSQLSPQSRLSSVSALASFLARSALSRPQIIKNRAPFGRRSRSNSTTRPLRLFGRRFMSDHPLQFGDPTRKFS